MVRKLCRVKSHKHVILSKRSYSVTARIDDSPKIASEDRKWRDVILKYDLFPEGLNGLTDRRKTAKNLVDSRKNWKILTVSRKWGKKN